MDTLLKPFLMIMATSIDHNIFQHLFAVGDNEFKTFNWTSAEKRGQGVLKFLKGHTNYKPLHPKRHWIFA